MSSGADAVILDLEDGVDPALRAEARAALGELAARNFRGEATSEGKAPRVFVRINALSTVDGIHDVAALLGWAHWPDGLMLPKVESAMEVAQIRRLAAEAEKPASVIPVIETATGLARADAIAANCGAIGGIGFGSADYTAETGGTMGRDALLVARGRIANAAAIAGAPAIDGAWLDLDDEAGLAAETRHARDLGFSAKIAIHPRQVATINRELAPSPAEAEQAARLLDAASRNGGGAFRFEGRMIDAPVLARARRILGEAHQPPSSPS